MSQKPPKASTKSVFSLLGAYKGRVVFLAAATIIGNGLGLLIPKLISKGIDTYTLGQVIPQSLYIQFALISFAVFAFYYAQGIFQTYLSEKAGYDLRERLVGKISEMSYQGIEKETPSKLLTNLTSDMDAIKNFLSFGVVMLISSIIVIIGSAGFLLAINWKLALAVLALLPAIGVMFFLVFKQLGPLFKKTQDIIDGFNLIISQNIIGAGIVRVLNSGKEEYTKFEDKNNTAKDNSMKILKLFAIVVPMIGGIANLASLVILALGGHYVIQGSMSIGDFTAFNGYVFILIFPIIMLGFVSSIISQAQASYDRVHEILALPPEKEKGTVNKELKGAIDLKNISLVFGEKTVLKDISLSFKPGTKNAILGPTAGGKTQLLNLLIGLIPPTEGKILFDGVPLEEYSKEALHSQVAFVFQDSVMFNLSVGENIAFSTTANQVEIEKAIETAELGDFVRTLPKGLDTSVSERGTSLSGGQKQRIMLARALALNPKVLFLDDFTARVDHSTEKKILANVEKNYPGITLVSVTQKVQSVEHFDQIILLMEGEVVVQGTHKELLETSPEYVQIMESQKSTQTYEK
ncbi:MAG: ABC transporter ATP-binding protein [Patescibacteria group bacterium]